MTSCRKEYTLTHSFIRVTNFAWREGAHWLNAQVTNFSFTFMAIVHIHSFQLSLINSAILQALVMTLLIIYYYMTYENKFYANHVAFRSARFETNRVSDALQNASKRDFLRRPLFIFLNLSFKQQRNDGVPILVFFQICIILCSDENRLFQLSNSSSPVFQ